MIGSLDPSRRQVTIVGAGISGLLAAYRLDQLGWEVTLLEAAPRAGGLISTEHLSNGIAESAAHSLLATASVRRLCGELGVELAEVRPQSRARYVWRAGKPRRFPLRPWEALAALARALFARAPRDRDPGSLTLEEWALRFLGRGPLRYLLNPFIRGIYGARPAELTVGAAFPALAVPRGRTPLGALLFGRRRPGAREPRPRMVAPLGGMGDLVERLDRRLTERLGARYRKGEAVERIPEAPNLILALPAREAARLIGASDAALSAALERIPYSPLAALTLFVDPSALARVPRGVGVLVPECESGRACLGILFNSSAFAGRVKDERSRVSLTMMIGGSARSELVGLSERELLDLAESELAAILGRSASAAGSRLVLESRVCRWERAVPRYGIELSEALRLARAGWCSRPGRVLTGNYTGQVSLRGMIQDVYERLPPA